MKCALFACLVIGTCFSSAVDITEAAASADVALRSTTPKHKEGRMTNPLRALTSFTTTPRDPRESTYTIPPPPAADDIKWFMDAFNGMLEARDSDCRKIRDCQSCLAADCTSIYLQDVGIFVFRGGFDGKVPDHEFTDDEVNSGFVCGVDETKAHEASYYFDQIKRKSTFEMGIGQLRSTDVRPDKSPYPHRTGLPDRLYSLYFKIDECLWTDEGVDSYLGPVFSENSPCRSLKTCEGCRAANCTTIELNSVGDYIFARSMESNTFYEEEIKSRFACGDNPERAEQAKMYFDGYVKIGAIKVDNYKPLGVNECAVYRNFIPTLAVALLTAYNSL